MLPRDAGVADRLVPTEDVRIFVHVEGSEAARAVRYRVVGREFSDLDTLSQRLRRIPREPAPEIRISCGPGIRYGEVVRLLDSLLLDGWSKIGFRSGGRRSVVE